MLRFSESLADRVAGDWRGLVSVHARSIEEANLGLAIICVESDGNVGAMRPEPHINDASYGLMQILLATARLFEPETTPSDLFIPDVNVSIGMRFLRDLISRYGMTSDAIAAYNAGRPLRNAMGLYVNQAYVDAVQTYWSYFQNTSPVDFVPGAVDDPLSFDLAPISITGAALGVGIGVVIVGVFMLMMARR